MNRQHAGVRVKYVGLEDWMMALLGDYWLRQHQSVGMTLGKAFCLYLHYPQRQGYLLVLRLTGLFTYGGDLPEMFFSP